MNNHVGVALKFVFDIFHVVCKAVAPEEPGGHDSGVSDGG